MRKMLGILSLALMGCLASGTTAPRAEEQQPAGQHLLVTLVMEKGHIRLEAMQTVARPLPKERDRGRVFPFRARLLAADGRVTFVRGFADPRVLRGEFQDPDRPGRIQSHHLLRTDPVTFVLRLPVTANRRLQIQSLPADQARSPRPSEDSWQTLDTLDLKREARP
jgi:hypothetical protein